MQTSPRRSRDVRPSTARNSTPQSTALAGDYHPSAQTDGQPRVEPVECRRSRCTPLGPERSPMRRTSHVTARRARPLALVTLGIGLVLLPACNDSGNTTINNQGLDCGLVRADLTGTWRVTFTTGTRNTTGCDVSAFDGDSVAVTSVPIDYPGVAVFGSDTSASFLVQGDRTDAGADAAVNPELTASVQADSCLAL